jgi:hypothetical protein
LQWSRGEFWTRQRSCLRGEEARSQYSCTEGSIQIWQPFCSWKLT